jgi:hypothetical protein
MRKTLLVSLAAAALLVGTGIAGAQQGSKAGTGMGATSTQGGSHQQQGAMSSGKSQGTTGQGSEEHRGAQTSGQGSSTGSQHQGSMTSGKSKETTGERSERHQGGAQTSGQASSTGQHGRAQGEKGGTQGQARSSSEHRGAQTTRPQTSGQAGSSERGGAQQGQAGTGEKGGTSVRGGTTGSGGSASLSSDQRTRIRETVLHERGAPRVDHVDFSLSVGTVVPRSVHVVRVPETIVRIYPGWRGYYYFVYNDEIIIVSSDHRIIAVIT